VIESINAVTLETADMASAVRFYLSLGFDLRYGGPEAGFSSFGVGTGHLNLEFDPTYQRHPGWGRVIFYVSDVDAIYQQALDLGYAPANAPSDATWGERYFHLRDPDGHELSFARLLEVRATAALNPDVLQK
jgi:catechol 2,3-dioxygenase-like lactoylglutathione lyase family enzyme